MHNAKTVQLNHVKGKKQPLPYVLGIDSELFFCASTLKYKALSK